MTDYTELVKALRCGEYKPECGSSDCPYWSGLGCMDGQLMEDAAAAIEALQAQLPKRGEWVYEELDNFRKYKVTCPHCGEWYIGNYDSYDEPSDFNFCPHCGNICNPQNIEWEKMQVERAKMEVQE